MLLELEFKKLVEKTELRRWMNEPRLGGLIRGLELHVAGRGFGFGYGNVLPSVRKLK